MIHIGEQQTEYRELCGCVWKHGKRVHVCPKHRHKDGIEPQKVLPRFDL